MCHAHTTEEMLQQKVSAIVDCYFQSSVPPPLQLDIQPSIADQVVKKQPGPYIFREAQVSIWLATQPHNVSIQMAHKLRA